MPSQSICEQIQCGILKAPADVSWQTVYDCAVAGFVGVRACSDPVCEQYGGCAAIFGAMAPVPEYEYPEGAQAPPVTEGPALDPWTGTTAIPAAAPPPVYEPPPAYTPADAADYLPEPPPEPAPAQETDTGEETPEGWTGLLIGDPDFEFTAAAVTGQAQELVERLTSVVKEWPWWIWLLVAGAGYQLIKDK